MRKIGSHYWLRPDGSIGKFPVIIFGDNNEIIEVRERAEFNEEPFLEHVNGFLVPGFVDVLPENIEPPYCKQLNRYVINGVKLLGVPIHWMKHFAECSKSQLELVQCNRCADESALTFEKIRSSENTLEALIKYTRLNAELLGCSALYGTLEVGKKPGLLSIRKMDYVNFQLNSESTLKIIV